MPIEDVALGKLGRLPKFRPFAEALLAVLAVILPATVVSGHSMTFLNTVSTTTCLAGGATGGVTLYSPAETDKTWVIRVRIGLSGGDVTQYARFDFYLVDNVLNTEVANYRAPGSHWGATGAWTFASTLTAHVGGTFFLAVTITNAPDGSSQCFLVFARAAYM